MDLWSNFEIAFLVAIVSLAVNECLPDGDLCKLMNGKKYYVDIGETGIIKAENVSSKFLKNETENLSLPKCTVELVSCPSCHIVVSVLYLNIPKCSSDNSCRCDYVWIKESAYAISGQKFCGFVNNKSFSLQYESRTKLVTIDFFYRYTYKDSFVLQFTAAKNVYVLKGHYVLYQSNTTNVFESPHFPISYPGDYSCEYIIRNIEDKGCIQITFIDFQLSPWSYIELFDSDNTRMDVYTGKMFRPPVIVSSGPTLTLKFLASDDHLSSGFRVTYAFISSNNRDWFTQTFTECGGIVDNKGGVITMMNMTNNSEFQLYDCIWLIHQKSLHVYETHLSVQVAQFEFMGSKSVLEIRQGLTSKSKMLESVTSFQYNKIIQGTEHIIPAHEGFYIRLQGFFNSSSRIAIVYTTFRYEACYSAGEFQCKNWRCIARKLQCDAFNHCGDNSDEHLCTGKGSLHDSLDRNWWKTLTPNYYFPKQSSLSTVGTNKLVLITSLAGLGIFIFMTVTILIRLHKKQSDEDSTRDSLCTHNGDIDQSDIMGVTSDLPHYDPPPSYEDVLKFIFSPPTYISVFGTHHNQVNSTTESLVPSAGTDNAANVSENMTDQRAETPHASQADLIGEGCRAILRVNLPLYVNTEDPQQVVVTENSLTNSFPVENFPESSISLKEEVPVNVTGTDGSEVPKIGSVF
ncbi:uncharacterized protein LOC106463020 [Limulus polyphemus]|uniref:Uncharacterized protein LOC106463020 n=1 Tax=Limulus polyphemus TaxID=6850 RepID=A0ABM1BB44_LIMPO|nr:uncharacterized protein LOC106463020 [Limulus polyphemus]